MSENFTHCSGVILLVFIKHGFCNRCQGCYSSVSRVFCSVLFFNLNVFVLNKILFFLSSFMLCWSKIRFVCCGFKPIQDNNWRTAYFLLIYCCLSQQFSYYWNILWSLWLPNPNSLYFHKISLYLRPSFAFRHQGEIRALETCDMAYVIFLQRLWMRRSEIS